MHSHISRNVPLPLTKSWNTYSLGHCGFLLDHKSKGTTLCHIHSTIYVLPYNGPPRQADRQGAVIQERGRRREERNEVKKEEFAIYD
jgi:hypothetical protein